MKVDITKITAFAVHAGREIMKIYESGDFDVEQKADDSPLTRADRVSHEIISAGLIQMVPDIPVLSEESAEIPWEIRKEWKQFWLVDPLDGTKEFIKRNGEFTVNIALMQNNRPIAGVIYAPDLHMLYYGTKETGAYKISESGKPVQIKADAFPKNGWTAVRSRSHAAPEEDAFFAKYPVTDALHVGSSLKFCMIAEGRAHIYYRHKPTMEWDTAAGHAIAEAAGAFVSSLDYNKKELRNASFYVSAAKI